jgi:pimeloyl-ACP methyl ester carboxylesterase
MPYATTDDGVRLYYEEAGSGQPLVFVHEFAGDHRSWEPQMRLFSRHFHCVAFSARGYPPSDVPPADRYSQARARDDIIAILDHLRFDRAHVVGLSMGGFATLHLGIGHPRRARSLVVAGCGYGAQPGQKEKFVAECEVAAAAIERDGMAKAAETYAIGPSRVQFQNKDPRGWRIFAEQLREHSTEGSARTLRGLQMRRPSLWELAEELKRMDVPTLIVTGDEDEQCLEPALLMKRTIPTSGLVVLPRAGHTLNLEDPEAFNRVVFDFISEVELGRWGRRDPRSVASGILGFGR